MGGGGRGDSKSDRWKEFGGEGNDRDAGEYLDRIETGQERLEN